jgi:lantibiotic biosynthesis protein
VSPVQPRYDCLEMPLVIGRVASLPVERATELLAAPDPLEAARVFFAENVFARTAVAIASPSLAAAIDEWIAGRPVRNAKTPLRALCYALRMASRATPFGLFAGVGAVATGQETSLELDESSVDRRTHTRPDMGLMGKLVESVEQGDLRERVAYTTNDCAFVAGDRLHVTNLALTHTVLQGESGVRAQREVSLRHTKAVAFLREYCIAGATYRDIASALGQEFGAPVEECERLLDRLIEAGVVISELRASPLGDPIAYLTERLEAIGAAPPALAQAFADAKRLDELPVAQLTGADFARVSASFQQTVDSAPANAIQVDLQAAFRGQLARSILGDAAQLADLALRWGQVTRLDRFRQRFIDRYEGNERMVPLLELIDNNLGLGIPDDPTADDADDTARQAALMHALSEAARANLEEIDLQGKLLEELLPLRATGVLPRSIEVGFELASVSPEALARGEYRIISTMFSDRTSKLIGRFGGLLGDEAAARSVEIARREAPDGELMAEFAFVPAESRSYNVFIRPRIYDCEVRAGIGSAPSDTNISPSDLWVGIDGGRFFLWSQSRGSRVSVCETHAFMTAANAPNLCRFLALIGRDGTRLPSFDLGAAGNMTYLPRLTCGRVVVRPRSWQFPRSVFGDDERAIASELQRKRERWNLPRFVYLTEHDNRLLLDLDSPVTAALLEDQAKGPRIAFQEALPAPSEMWLRGSTGTHSVEFVAQAVAAEGVRPAVERRPVPVLVQQRDRHGPGSQWVYLKLYLGAQSTDDFIVSALTPLVAELRAAGAIDRWFFLRYADPCHHVRLRLHAPDPQTAAGLRARTLSETETWLQSSRLTRYTLDTYDPEYERYGGAGSLHDAEEFFAFDSGICASILAEGVTSTDALVEAAAASFDVWTRSSRVASPLLLEIFAPIAKKKLETRDRASLRRIASLPETSQDNPLDAVIAGPNAAAHLRSFVHMHCNRLGLDSEGEGRVCSLLRALALSRLARDGARATVSAS